MSGQSHLDPGEVWPVKRILHKIPGFELRKIYAAIKTMVIAYDRMTKLQLAQMTTDDEIVINSENLLTLYMQSATAVRATYGR